MCVDITAHDLLAAKSKQNRIKLYLHFGLQLKGSESNIYKMSVTVELRIMIIQKDSIFNKAAQKSIYSSKININF